MFRGVECKVLEWNGGGFVMQNGRNCGVNWANLVCKMGEIGLQFGLN